MDNFETPSWDVENETEKWVSDLFASSNIKRSKVPKKRKRNKYPKGFGKIHSSETVEESKDESTSGVNYIKPENSDRYTSDISSPKGKRKKKSSEKGACDFDSKIVKVGENSIVKEASSKLNLKKKKRSKPSLDRGVNEKSIVDDTLSTKFKPTVSTAPKLNSKKKRKKSDLVKVDEPSSAKCKVVNENSMAVDDLCTNSQERLAIITTPKLNRKKKKKKKSKLINVDKSSSAKYNEVSENSMAIDSLRTNSQETLSMTPKLSPKKKKEINSGESKKKQIKALDNLKTLQNQLNLSDNLIGEGIEHFNENSDGNSQNKIKKNKKSNKTTKRPQVMTDEDEQSKDDDKEQCSEPGNVVGNKRRHCEEEVVSKKKRKKSRKAEKEFKDDGEIQIFSGHTNENRLEKQQASFQGSEMKKSYPSDVSASPGIKKKKLSLREKMEEKLRGARFRFLNEQLYTSKSKDTNNFFLLDRKAFEAYHEGYEQQLMQWPVKPVDLIIKSLMKKPSSYVIADFGCGDAKLAQSLPNMVHSFDHVALNKHVTVCDMAHTPLTKGSVDVVVFCLSLMGSNLSEYIAEANRVLKIGGLLKIAEVESRFDDVNNFVKLINKFGFLRIHQDSSNDYFYLFDFRKEKNLKEGKVLPSIELRACYYKKR